MTAFLIFVMSKIFGHFVLKFWTFCFADYTKTLPPFVQNKTIQKARESRRISTETKEYLLKFKL